MTDELARVERGGLVSSFEDAARAAKAMAQSKYFSDADDVSKAMVKILAGHEMGFGAFASMSGIHVIKGKPSIGANLMAAAVKSHPRYDYRVRKMQDDVVALEFFERGESVGMSEFTEADAQKAGTQNMGKFARNMLFARAMSNGVKWYAPDVFNGSAVYTPDELGATVDGDGQYVDAQAHDIEEITEPGRNPKSGIEDVMDMAADDLIIGIEEVAPAPHWIKDTSARKSFWEWARTDCGLTDEGVHTALGVEHIEDYAGSKRDALNTITQYIESGEAADDEQPF